MIAATILAHYVLAPYQPIQFFTSAIAVAVLYPALRLTTSGRRADASADTGTP